MFKGVAASHVSRPRATSSVFPFPTSLILSANSGHDSGHRSTVPLGSAEISENDTSCLDSKLDTVTIISGLERDSL